MDDFEYFWDWLKHEDNLLVSRGNYFMVAESMLFAAAAQILAAKFAWPFYVLGGLGVAITLLWLATNVRQISQTMVKVKLQLQPDRRFAIVNEHRASGWSGPSRLIGYVLPAITGIAWLALLATGAKSVA